MFIHKYCALTVVIVALVIPTESDDWLNKTIKNLGRGIRKYGKQIKKVKDAVVKTGCKVLFGVACPVGVAMAGAYVAGSTMGVSAPVVAAGVVLGTKGCEVVEKGCKRSVNMTEILLPFSDEMSDYDFNGDKRITYTEFVWAVIRSVPLVDPDQLWKPFSFADFNGDGELDWQEFQGAPFLFAHADRENIPSDFAAQLIQ